MKRVVVIMTVVLSASSAMVIAGTASATTPAWVETTAICPTGSEIDPQNSQQCRSLSPAGAESSISGCQSAGYSIDPRGSGYCVNSAGQDTLGSQH